jgi:hypothetical protein
LILVWAAAAGSALGIVPLRRLGGLVHVLEPLAAWGHAYFQHVTRIGMLLAAMLLVVRGLMRGQARASSDDSATEVAMQIGMAIAVTVAALAPVWCLLALREFWREAVGNTPQPVTPARRRADLAVVLALGWSAACVGLFGWRVATALHGPTASVTTPSAPTAVRPAPEGTRHGFASEHGPR